MIAIASRAAAVRAAEGRTPFQYAVVLTKTDKAGEKQLRLTEQEVRTGLAQPFAAGADEAGGDGAGVEGSSEAVGAAVAGGRPDAGVGAGVGVGVGAGASVGVGVGDQAAGVAVLRTSSVARVGRDDVWRLLQGVLQRRLADPQPSP